MRQQQRPDAQRPVSIAIAGLLAIFLCAPAVAQKAPAVRPPPAAAHAAADAGYKAYARRDFTEAIVHAQRAVQLAPDRRDWWILLANSQLAAGNPAAAEQSLARAAQVQGDDAALASARADLGRVRAQTAAGAMYQALQANDLNAAVSLGRSAIEGAPDNAAYRLVLIHALLRNGQFAEAEKVASETVALVPESGVALAMRGYARNALGRPAEAAADLDRALQQPGTTPATQRQLRLLAADLALARGDVARANEVLQPLPATDADARTRRDFALAAEPGRPASIALVPPGIDCSDAATANTCGLRTAALPQAPGFASATAAYRAMEQKENARALEQARLATTASPRQRDWQLLHMNAALAAGEREEAERAATAALALRPDPVVLAQRSTIRRQLGNVAGANEDAEAALQSGQLPPGQEATLLADLGRRSEARARLEAAAGRTDLTPAGRLELAYLAQRMGDNEAARVAFQQADAAGGLPPTSLLDAGYAAMHARKDAEAIGYFHRAIDEANGLRLKMEPQMLYDTRRTVAEVSRKWGVLASITSRNGAGPVPGFGTTVGGLPGSARVVQAGAEAYYRPWGFMNGQFVELFARGFETLSSKAGGLEGGESFSGAVGARWKPISGQNAVLSISRVFGPNVIEDWLFQAAYSYDYGTDLRVDVPSWWTSKFYAEFGRYLSHNPRNYALATWLAGRSYAMGENGRTVLFPHGVAAWEYSEVDSPKSSVGIGPGVAVRHWFREDVYNAPRSYVDLVVQYRFRAAGDDRMRGFFVNTLLSY